MNSWSERIGPFHGEAGLTDLWRLRRGNAGELRPDVVADKAVAVRAVVIPQAQIGTYRLRVGCIHLNQARESQKASERIVRLQACEHYRKITIGQRQSKPLPGFRGLDRELCGRAIIGPHAEFIQ